MDEIAVCSHCQQLFTFWTEGVSLPMPNRASIKCPYCGRIHAQKRVLGIVMSRSLTDDEKRAVGQGW